jgi:PAS domain-containing protein
VGQRTKIVYANDAAGALLGTKSSELLAKSLSEFGLAGQNQDNSTGDARIELRRMDKSTTRVTLTTGRTTWNTKPAILYFFSV